MPPHPPPPALQSLAPSPPPFPLTPPPQRTTNLLPLGKHAIMPKQNQTLNTQASQPPDLRYQRIEERPILKKPRRTNPVVWCSAVVCLMFSLLLIFFGVATLVVYLAIKPRTPLFDTTNARLNTVYFDSPEHFNGDFTVLANFSNPNKKIDLKYEYALIQLYFSNTRIASQALRPFSQRRGQSGSVAVHLISSLVYLPQNHALELQKQVLSNKVMYDVRGTFRVKVRMGLIHFSYWLHAWCELEMTSPPVGVLLARNCKTKRSKMQ